MRHRRAEPGLAVLVLLAACTGDGRELAPPRVAPPPVVTSPSFVTGSGAEAIDRSPTVVVDALWSPRNGVATVVGSGATAADPVTVDGEPAAVLSFEASDDGGFELEVHIAEEGAHTVCVAGVCGRVFTLAPTQPPP